uniref:Uncharacterized protein n=1 Tax=Streptomyces violaceusniger TaxID=68280 RepID=A0A6F8Z2H1_STRVO|nr:hypothetical protein [Streptomyces violaceusniger]
MDYCPPCRRHLNGALSCPGCGKPVEKLELPTAATAPAAEAGAAGTGDSSGAPVSRAEQRKAQKSHRSQRSRGARGSRPGRKSGHRARSGRTRRVMVTAAVLGPVLAALFVAELATEGYFREAAPTPSREKPVADPSGGVTESAEPVARDSGGPSADPSTRSGRPDKDTEDGAQEKAKGEKKAEDTTSPGPDRQTSDDPGSSAPATGGPAPSHPSTPPSKPRPTTPGTSGPIPTPKPSQTCDRFLWWCT